MRRIIRNTIFFIGWMLSPLTFWNDIFFNIPLSYLCASILVRVIRVDFLALVLIFYWASNLLGLYMMYASGRAVFKSREGALKEVITLIVTILVYSIVLLGLNSMGILKPV